MTEALQQEIRTLKDIFESERDPEGRAFAPLADAYRRAGELQQAVRLLSEGLARHPKFVPGHVVAAHLYVEQGLTEEAEIAARQALDLDAENVNAMRSLLQVLEGAGDAEADGVRERLETLDPTFVEVGGEREGALEAQPPLPEAVEQPTPFEADAVIDGQGEEGEVSLAEMTGAPESSEVAVVDEPSGEPLIDLDSLAADLPEVDVDFPMASGLAPVSDAELPTEEPLVDLDDLPVVGSEEAEAASARLLDLPPVVPDDAGAAATAFDEPVMELADLGPEPAEGEPWVGLDVVEASADEPVMDLATLAPDEEPEPVMDLATLAPDEEPEPVMDLAALAPDEAVLDTSPQDGNEGQVVTMIDLVDQTSEVEADSKEAASASEDEDVEHVPGEPVYTRTLAELYVKQGALGQALEVYKHLSALSPDDSELARRIEELEAGSMPEGDGDGVLRHDVEEEVEALARELTEHGPDPQDLESPYGHGEQPDATPAAESSDSGPTIGDYFEGLLGWDSENPE